MLIIPGYILHIGIALCKATKACKSLQKQGLSQKIEVDLTMHRFIRSGHAFYAKDLSHKDLCIETLFGLGCWPRVLDGKTVSARRSSVVSGKPVNQFFFMINCAGHQLDVLVATMSHLNGCI